MRFLPKRGQFRRSHSTDKIHDDSILISSHGNQFLLIRLILNGTDKGHLDWTRTRSIQQGLQSKVQVLDAVNPTDRNHIPILRYPSEIHSKTLPPGIF